MPLPKDFFWGVATASYQIEGAWNEDGKGPSIWDTYTHWRNTPVHNHENGDVACDHYHRMKEDVALMKQIGVKAYRFSISWPRVIPDGTGDVNQKGLQFYSDLVDELIKNDIEPLVTIYHWDMPQAIFERGGWLNPESVGWFENYTKVVIDALSDRVSYWFTFNEPQIFLGLGCYMGTHAPFMKYSDRDLFRMSKNVMLAHGTAVNTIRKIAKKAPKISYAPTGPSFIPDDDSSEAIEKARSQTFAFDEYGYMLSNSFWSDPIILGKWPEGVKEFFGNDFVDFTEDEWKIVTAPLDFYGMNIYAAMRDLSKLSAAEGNEALSGEPLTAIKWSITPDVLYWSAKFMYERYHLPIMITENGCACTDSVHLDGKVHDPQRIDFLKRYIRAFYKAGEDGIPLVGYTHWSFMDNFEWADGYDPRFGLVYVNYQTQERTLKDSAYWYKEVIKTNGESLWK